MHDSVSLSTTLPNTETSKVQTLVSLATPKRKTLKDNRDFNLPAIDWTAISPFDLPSVDAPNHIIPHTNRCQLHDTFIDIINTF